MANINTRIAQFFDGGKYIDRFNAKLTVYVSKNFLSIISSSIANTVKPETLASGNFDELSKTGKRGAY